ncbi:MAG: pyridoxal phosphate-dependent decarboxylase family protein [Pirellulales bacterium]|jgi:aromatic-L-amino-acid decarboxylase
MQYEELPAWSAKAAAWAAQYHATLRDRPIRPNVVPGDFLSKIPTEPPQSAEPFENIFADFVKLVPDSMTHWQHPRFFAYFSSNASPASMLAEQLANAISAQCMLWQTSPAATELETAMVDWLRQALAIPVDFRGVIQDTATSATLSAVLTMRERALNWRGIEEGLSGMPILRIYASEQTHSSIDKAVRLAGIGQNNLVKVKTDSDWAMCPSSLQSAIETDRANGLLPAGVIGCIGGTSIGASDRLDQILEIAKQNDLYSHVDAAWAGSAMICPEFRSIWKGVEMADSLVFNPHKWLGANFDCSVQFLKEPKDQIKTLAIKPSYLQTLEQDGIDNYSEWCIPLGRRFRALKLWFLMRSHGLDGLQERIRNHIKWAGEAAEEIEKLDNFSIITPPMFSLFTFRFEPPGQDAGRMTRDLIEKINADGRIYLTQTTHDGKFVIRFTIGQFDTTRADVKVAIEVIEELAGCLT